MITLGAMLTLLAIGVALMLSPIKSGKESVSLASERVEPQVCGELMIAEGRAAYPRVRQANNAANPSADVEEKDALPDPSGRDVSAHQTSIRQDDTGDEDLYLSPGKEADDERQPAPWAKVIASNEGKEGKAEHHHIGSQAAQLNTHARTPEMNSSIGGDENFTERMSSLAADRAPDAETLQETFVPGEVFVRSKIADAISGRIPLGRLVGSAELLSDYCVSEYVTKDVIREKAVERGSPHHDAASYFDSYRHRTSVEVADALRNVDPAVASKYLESRHFRHPYVVDFFDEVVVCTLLPGSSRMEFLVLSPMASFDDDLLKGLIAPSRITELLVAAGAEGGNPLMLYQELERMFGYFSGSKA